MPVFLPGKSHWQGSLEGYSHGVTKSWTWLSTHAQFIEKGQMRKNISNIYEIVILHIQSALKSLQEEKTNIPRKRMWTFTGKIQIAVILMKGSTHFVWLTLITKEKQRRRDGIVEIPGKKTDKVQWKRVKFGRLLITQGDKKQSGHEKPASAKSAPASLTLAMEPLNKGEDTLSPLIHQDGLNWEEKC